VNQLYIIASAILGAQTSYWLRHRMQVSVIRASTLAGLGFLLLTSPFSWTIIPKLQASFYGASFVGVSDANRLSERSIIIGAVIFSGLFYLAGYLPISLGGTLGASAFLSALFTHYMLVSKKTA
jgi:hypothetical protein